MRPNLRIGVLAIAAATGAVLAGCEANGGNFGGGGGGGGGDGAVFEHCFFPFGPSSQVVSLVTDDCLICSVTNEGALIDSDPATFATISVTSLIGGIGLIKAGFDDPNNPNPSGAKFAAGSIAGYVIGFPGLVEASVLPDFSLVTKLDNVVQEEFQFTGILGAELLAAIPSGGPFHVGVTTSKDFDAVEFKVTTDLANVLNSVNLYAACGDSDESTDLPFILL